MTVPPEIPRLFHQVEEADLVSLINGAVFDFLTACDAASALSTRLKELLTLAANTFNELRGFCMEDVPAADRSSLPLQSLAEWAIQLRGFPWEGPESAMFAALYRLNQVWISDSLHQIDCYLRSSQDGRDSPVDRDRELRRFTDVRRSIDHVRDAASRAQLTAASAEQQEEQRRRSEALAVTQAAAEEVQEVLDSAREASGTVSSIVLHEAMTQFAKKEYSRTRLLRVAGVTSLMLAASVAGWLTFRMGPDLTWGLEMARLTLTVPMIVVGVYFLREAGHARHEAVTAARYAVRLQGLRAYVGELESPQRREILGLFGHQLFITSAAPVPNNTDDSQDVVEQLKALAEVLKSVRGS